MAETGVKPKSLVIEGKTKQVWEIAGAPDEVLVISKDCITAFNGVRGHDLPEKAAISTQTTSNIFTILNAAGVGTAFLKKYDEKSFLAARCEMIPVEWVARRLATGSFLKRHPGIPEGTRFYPPKVETFFKDDANNDPQWNDEQIIAAGWKPHGLLIGAPEVDIMRKTTITVFEILERYWATQNCVLVDMKIEFGVTSKGIILLADVIDNDSWRLWPSGDKRLMKDKQVYRNLANVTDADLITIKDNFKWVADKTDILKTIESDSCLAVIILGSRSDEKLGHEIGKQCLYLGVPFKIRVSSAHKSTEDVLKIISEYDACGKQVVYIAVAGRSNGLGLVISANTVSPVINCPPSSPNLSYDIWSSLNVPSGLGCTTVIYPEAAAQAAAHILASSNSLVWAKIRAKQLNNYIALKICDKAHANTRESDL